MLCEISQSQKDKYCMILLNRKQNGGCQGSEGREKQSCSSTDINFYLNKIRKILGFCYTTLRLQLTILYFALKHLRRKISCQVLLPQQFKKKNKKVWYIKVWNTETFQNYFTYVVEINSDSFMNVVNQRYSVLKKVKSWVRKNSLYLITTFRVRVDYCSLFMEGENEAQEFDLLKSPKLKNVRIEAKNKCSQPCYLLPHHLSNSLFSQMISHNLIQFSTLPLIRTLVE